MSVALIAAASVFASCDDDKETNIGLSPSQPDTHTEAPEPVPMDPPVGLFNDLHAFNDSLVMASTGQGCITRGGGFWSKLLKIVCADISGARDGAAVGALFGGEGAAIGGAVGAALYSWNAGASAFGYQVASGSNNSTTVSQNQLQVEKAYVRMQNDDSHVNKVPTIQLGFPAAYASSATAIGKSHNAILDLCKGNVAETVAIEEITGTLSNFQVSVIHSPKFVSVMNNAVSSGNYTVDNSDATGNYIINLFMSVADGCTGSQQDLHYIINRYISIIEANGSLSNADKTQVYNALSVAAYSCDYWENYAQ